MPLRYIAQSQTFQNIVEGSILSMLSVFAIISETDWQRVTGPHGVAFVAIAAVIVLWGSGIRDKNRLRKETEARENREEERRIREEANREKRHAESLLMQGENAKRLMELTVEGIKAQGMVATALRDLKTALDGRPCGVAAMKTHTITETATETTEEQDNENNP